MMTNRIAIITGASSGIGRATALRLADKGVRLVLNARNEEKLEDVRREVAAILGEGACRVVSGDVSDNQVVEACMKESLDAWETTPDIFVASAGRGLPGTVIDSDSGQWESLIDINIKGLMYQLRAAGKAMLELSSEDRDVVMHPLDIVVIGSSIGRNVSPFNSVYGSTKFAAHGLTEGLRRQLGPKGIRVTLIEPGLVGTDFQRAAGYDLHWFEGYSKEVGPILKADDVAGIIAFLVDLPGNVHLDNVSIRPTRQAYP
jgi:NADP-dependent 3-hydroxy acid dehydrogenase YdfG